VVSQDGRFCDFQSGALVPDPVSSIHMDLQSKLYCVAPVLLIGNGDIILAQDLGGQRRDLIVILCNGKAPDGAKNRPGFKADKPNKQLIKRLRSERLGKPSETREGNGNPKLNRSDLHVSFAAQRVCRKDAHHAAATKTMSPVMAHRISACISLVLSPENVMLINMSPSNVPTPGTVTW